MTKPPIGQDALLAAIGAALRSQLEKTAETRRLSPLPQSASYAEAMAHLDSLEKTAVDPTWADRGGQIMDWLKSQGSAVSDAWQGLTPQQRQLATLTGAGAVGGAGLGLLGHGATSDPEDRDMTTYGLSGLQGGLLGAAAAGGLGYMAPQLAPHLFGSSASAATPGGAGAAGAGGEGGASAAAAPPSLPEQAGLKPDTPLDVQSQLADLDRFDSLNQLGETFQAPNTVGEGLTQAATAAPALAGGALAARNAGRIMSEPRGMGSFTDPVAAQRGAQSLLAPGSPAGSLDTLLTSSGAVRGELRNRLNDVLDRGVPLPSDANASTRFIGDVDSLASQYATAGEEFPQHLMADRDRLIADGATAPTSKPPVSDPMTAVRGRALEDVRAFADSPNPQGDLPLLDKHKLTTPLTAHYYRGQPGADAGPMPQFAPSWRENMLRSGASRLGIQRQPDVSYRPLTPRRNLGRALVGVGGPLAAGLGGSAAANLAVDSMTTDAGDLEAAKIRAPWAASVDTTR